MNPRTMAPPKTLSSPAPDSRLDGQHPWPGLEAYREEDEPFFQGRTTEIEDLYRLIRRERLTLLFGKAGMGKTSLLRAGLFPKQRDGEALPVYVRLDYSEDAPELGIQVKQAIAAAARDARMQGPSVDAGESLWEYLHLDDGEFWSEHHRLAMPFIVFDQFEELFTIGRSQRPSAVRAFISELSDLAEDRIPVDLRLRLDQHRDQAGRYNLKRHHYKIVLCLREEYMAELDRIRDDLPPALFQNRMRMMPMTVDQAVEVVRATGADVGADALAEDIVHRAAEETDEEGKGKSYVSPAVLSLLCTTMNRDRLADGAALITKSYLEKAGTNVLDTFYEKGLQDLPKIPGDGVWPPGRARRVNARIAKEFVDGDRRVSLPSGRAQDVLGGAALGELVRRGVLSYNEHGRVELVHDVLTDTVHASTGRFARTLIKALTAAIPIAVLAALALGALGALAAERMAISHAPVPMLEPDVGGTGGAQAFALNLVDELNDGTDRIREAFGHFEERDFAQASGLLPTLGADLDRRRLRYCVGSADRTLAQLLRDACGALIEQQNQLATLQELRDEGPAGLSDPAVEGRVVPQWQRSEGEFEERRRAINDLIPNLTTGGGA